MPAQSHTLSYLLSAVLVALVFGMRFWRMRSRAAVARRLRLETLWIMPAIMVVAAIAMLIASPPQGLGWLWMALALAIGGALGWVRGGLMHIEVDRATHQLNMRTSPAALLFLLALFALRYGARIWLSEAGSSLHVSVALVTDAFVLFAVGLFGLSRVEMALRARRLLREARAANVTGVVSDGRAPTGSVQPWG